MKVLSLKQPFAELVVSGKKTIELRKWRTTFRGPFLVHASLSVDTEAMQRFGFTDLPKGGIVGEAELLDVTEYTSAEEHARDADKHLADSGWGTYGFVLSKARRLPFVPCKGKLNFWDFEGKA